jgi:hypothetical protein
MGAKFKTFYTLTSQKSLKLDETRTIYIKYDLFQIIVKSNFEIFGFAKPTSLDFSLPKFYLHVFQIITAFFMGNNFLTH